MAGGTKKGAKKAAASEDASPFPSAGAGETRKRSAALLDELLADDSQPSAKGAAQARVLARCRRLCWRAPRFRARFGADACAPLRWVLACR